MKKPLFLLMTVLMICACGSATPAPVWQDNAYRHLEDYKINFLAGKEDATEPHFIKARREITAGNDLSLLTTAYLTNYALHTASLERFDAAEFAKLQRLEPNAANMSYCHFLKGNFNAANVQELPTRYAGIMKAAAGRDAVLAAREIAAIDDPLSRLIACGVWVKYMPYDESILQIAINTASANGWRRPLWAYLDKLQTYYLERGDKIKAGIIKDRLDLLKK
jgi:hypothetical protein